jgi:ketosteroid isomerase-like protein
MSQENVETVRRIHEFWQRREFDQALDAFDPDVVWTTTETGEFHGHDGVKASLREWVGTFDDYRYDVVDVIDVDDARVLVIGHQSGKGRGSGVPVASDNFTLWTLRGGKVVELAMFQERDEALEAAGLSG